MPANNAGQVTRARGVSQWGVPPSPPCVFLKKRNLPSPTKRAAACARSAATAAFAVVEKTNEQRTAVHPATKTAHFCNGRWHRVIGVGNYCLRCGSAETQAEAEENFEISMYNLEVHQKQNNNKAGSVPKQSHGVEKGF